MFIKDCYSQKTLHLVYQVRNMEVSKKFYSEILELPVTFEAPQELGWCEIALPVTGVYLALRLINPDSTLEPANTLHLNSNNIEKTAKLLQEKGLNTSEITDIPNLSSFFSIKDPDQNVISFIGIPRKHSRK